MVASPSAWQDRAACGDSDLDFISTTDRGYAPSVIAALELCAGCPVRAECLRSALSAPFDAVGVWGGTTRRERHAAMGNHPQASYTRDRAGLSWVRRIEGAVIELEGTFDVRYTSSYQGQRALATA